MEVEYVILHVGVIFTFEFFGYRSGDTVHFMSHTVWSLNSKIIWYDVFREIFFAMSGLMNDRVLPVSTRHSNF
jgi:hypothetical protein